ncbi:hypothetical protein SAMN04489725_13113 [Alicyclobacillus hesperidum]|uniref:Uncharacterized protein n=1 Tax=Alicyclobacillus hesperidum TaxID=89784 RepID=A0A1H2YB12_9BACL|nr:hypothetical protein [Alicyclobacillus hesperidum]SDX02231.1 hypothetical protein SAMN04489725_13113 [Alicyclobacillus hesperidum]
MERSILMGDRTGWTVRLEELDEHVEVIRQVLQECGIDPTHGGKGILAHCGFCAGVLCL